MALTRNTDWRHLGAVPFEIWKKRILDAGGLPAFAERNVWEALGDDSALGLAQLEAESSYASDFDHIPAWMNDPWNLQIDGEGIEFDTAVEAAQAWRNRLYDPTYKGGVYTKTKTLFEMVSAYAPREDGNDPEGYTDGLIAEMQRNGFVSGGSTPMPPVFDPEVIKRLIPKIEDRYVYKRREGQGFDYGNRGPIEGLFVHERQGRIANSGKIGQQFFTCWTKESCDQYGICEDGERCENALVDGEVLRDGTLVLYQDPFNTDRIPYASGGTIQNWSNPVGQYINTNFPYVNDRFAAIETEKTDNERLSPEQIQTVGIYGAYILAKAGKKKREFWSLPNHGDVYNTTCAMFADDRVKFEAVCDKTLDDFWNGRLPEQTGGTTPPPTIYAPAIPVAGLDKYMNADPNTVPAVVSAEGSDWIFVNDVVKVVRDTPRLQRAKPDALKVGPVVQKGEDFTAKFMVKSSAGDWYYLTRYYTRIQVRDTTRSKDSV